MDHRKGPFKPLRFPANAPAIADHFKASLCIAPSGVASTSGTGLDLARAQRVRPPDHRAGLRALGRDDREIVSDALGVLKEVEPPLHTCEHAEREAVDLHELQGVDVVLVPIDDLTIGHRRAFDRHQFVKAIVREDEIARLLREIPGRQSTRARARSPVGALRHERAFSDLPPATFRQLQIQLRIAHRSLDQSVKTPSIVRLAPVI